MGVVTISRARVEAVPGFLRFYSLLGDTELEPGPRSDVLYSNATIAVSFSRALSEANSRLVNQYLYENDARDYGYLVDGSQRGWRIVVRHRDGSRERYFERAIFGFRTRVRIHDPEENARIAQRLAQRLMEEGGPIELEGDESLGGDVFSAPQADERATGALPKTWNLALLHYVPLPTLRYDAFGTEEMWLSYSRCLRRRADAYHTDDQELGVLSLGLTPPYAVRMFPIPALFPERKTSSNDACRELALVAASSAGMLTTLTSPFSDARGWGKDNFVFELDPRSPSWRQLALGAPGVRSRAVAIDRTTPVEDPEWSLSGGELNVYDHGDGKLELYVDGAPYHLDDWTVSHHPLGTLTRHDLLPKRASLGLHEREVLAEDIDGDVLKSVDPRLREATPAFWMKEALHAELLSDGRVLVLFRLSVGDTKLGALGVFECTTPPPDAITGAVVT